MKLAPFPNPAILIAKWQAGEIEREEMQRLMAEHQRALLDEAEEQRKNPFEAYWEGILNRRSARRLVKEHGESAVRELLLALSAVPDFTPSAYLWNADHWDVGLECFIRSRSEPIFRIKELMVRRDRALMLVEHGGTGKGELRRERVRFLRDWRGEMKVTEFVKS